MLPIIKNSKPLNWLLLAIYYTAVVGLHGQVGRLINGSFANVSRTTYNNIITVIFIIILGYLGYKLYPKIRQHPSRKALLYIAIYTLLAVLFSFTVLFVIHIEAIHFVQYAILAALLFPLVRQYSSTAIWGTLAGAFDELYQYLWLDTRAQYYDFNDVFLDAIGVGIGLLILKVIGAEGKDKRAARVVWYRRAESIALGLLGIALVVMALTGDFSVNYDYDDPAFFTLFKMVPEGFWHYPAGPYARFHILTPIPGLILIVMSNVVYGWLDRL